MMPNKVLNILGSLMIVSLGFMAGCANRAQGAPAASDSDLQRMISDLWQKDHPNAASAPNISVSNGLVSLTGTLDTPQQRIDAVREAWATDGVTEVVNELEVVNGASPTWRKDRATTIELRTRLTFDTAMDVVSTNYSIETLNGTVYLMGIAHDQAELDKVKQVAQDTVGKGKVVSYVRVRPPAPSSDS